MVFVITGKNTVTELGKFMCVAGFYLFFASVGMPKAPCHMTMCSRNESAQGSGPTLQYSTHVYGRTCGIE